MRRLTPTVIAAVALIFAMTGGALAAGHYLITSTTQIKPSVLSQLKGKTGPAGPKGATGATGPAGTAGATGPAGPGGAGAITLQDVTTTTAICANSGGSCSVPAAIAACPTGSYVTGGSASASTINTTVSTIAAPTEYTAVAVNESSSAGQLSVTAICATGTAVTAVAPAARGASITASELRAQLRR